MPFLWRRLRTKEGHLLKTNTGLIVAALVVAFGCSKSGTSQSSSKATGGNDSSGDLAAVSSERAAEKGGDADRADGAGGPEAGCEEAVQSAFDFLVDDGIELDESDKAEGIEICRQALEQTPERAREVIDCVMAAETRAEFEACPQLEMASADEGSDRPTAPAEERGDRPVASAEGGDARDDRLCEDVVEHVFYLMAVELWPDDEEPEDFDEMKDDVVAECRAEVAESPEEAREALRCYLAADHLEDLDDCPAL